ncbi:hypothetical protein COO60DRAFT_980959 [Scenedesmus sp. NREL 46B-D3]|nr:hypothetical protein COO60DRAFT_980959 [Scenedesmus sp. NREL 46B-D3]
MGNMMMMMMMRPWQCYWLSCGGLGELPAYCMLVPCPLTGPCNVWHASLYSSIQHLLHAVWIHMSVTAVCRRGLPYWGLQRLPETSMQTYAALLVYFEMTESLVSTPAGPHHTTSTPGLANLCGPDMLQCAPVLASMVFMGCSGADNLAEVSSASTRTHRRKIQRVQRRQATLRCQRRIKH